MKKIIFALAGLLVISASVYSQDLAEVKLNAPNKSRGSVVTKALSERQSVREYDTKEISLQDLSDLLWAANGVNREDGKRTAPTAMNRQEIDVYVVNKDGVYLYDAPGHVLKPVSKGDYRKSVAAQQDFAATAPISIILVANLEKLGDPTKEGTRMTASFDAGIVCQNINIFCSAVGLATVPRGSMNQEELRKVLKLSDTQIISINNPVGYPKK